MNDSSRSPHERPGATSGEIDAAEGVALAGASPRVNGVTKALHRMMWAVMGSLGPMIACRERTGFVSR